jgi:1,2-phenylacetyl-CoA epoxidase catalytic subunit
MSSSSSEQKARKYGQLMMFSYYLVDYRKVNRMHMFFSHSSTLTYNCFVAKKLDWLVTMVFQFLFQKAISCIIISPFVV